MAKKNSAVIALLIGLPLALNGQSIQSGSVNQLSQAPLSTAQQIDAILPLENLVAAEILHDKAYELIRPVDIDTPFQQQPVQIISAETLLSLAQTTRSTRF